ncbi:MAG: hypothetical protein EXQ58_12350 [Acidobacteria bacterium]|nr:hypothetical protein [Acidobacteriota bacterium]
MRRTIPVSLILPMMVAVMLAAGFSAETAEARAMQAGDDSRTILDGVYTSAQATRGKNGFAMNCSSCHGEDLAGMSAPALKGGHFLDNWREDILHSLFNLIKTTMPPNREKLSEDAYLDILTYILEVNTFPAGGTELKASLLKHIQFVGKDGPQPVPEYALVSMVGCLTQTPDGIWRLTKASQPIRIRNGEKPTEEELKASVVNPLGPQTFRLVYPDSFSPDFRIDAHKGHKMEGRGYLLMNPIDQRLSVTWLEMVASGCGE